MDEIHPITGPVLILEHNKPTISYDLAHILDVQIDVAVLQDGLDTLVAVAEKGLREMESTFGAADTFHPTTVQSPDNKTVFPINTPTGREFASTLGHVKMQLAATLWEATKIKEGFSNYLATFMPSYSWSDEPSVRTLEGHYDPVTNLLMRNIQKASKHLGIDSSRRRRSITEELNLPSRVGEVFNNMGIHYEGEKMSIDQRNIKELFLFSNALAHKVNMTLFYLNRVSVLNTRLVDALHETEVEKLDIDDRLSDDRYLQQLIFKLVKIQSALERIDSHLTDVKLALLGNQSTLSSLLLPPDLLREHVDRIKLISTYEPVYEVMGNLHIYYNELISHRHLGEDSITFRLEIPLKDVGSTIPSTTHLSISKVPIHHQDIFLSLNWNIPTDIVYDSTSGVYTPLTACVPRQTVTLCRPKFKKSSPCLNAIIQQDDWSAVCPMTERLDLDETWIQPLQDDMFLLTPSSRLDITRRCWREVYTDNLVTRDVVSSTSWWQDAGILKAQPNCEYTINDTTIPRILLTYSNTTVLWESHLNISQWDDSIFSNSTSSKNTLLHRLDRLRNDFITARLVEASKSHFPGTRTSIYFIWGVQGLQSFFIALLLLWYCTKCVHQRRTRNSEYDHVARLEGNVLVIQP